MYITIQFFNEKANCHFSPKNNVKKDFVAIIVTKRPDPHVTISLFFPLTNIIKYRTKHTVLILSNLKDDMWCIGDKREISQGISNL